MARLSVNLNKIALFRNSRRTGVPNVVEFAQICMNAGAAGITLHPRPDERHVRRTDVGAIADAMKDRRPRIELNIEGYPDPRWIEICTEVKPEQCTLVPDSPSAFTSEEGWKLDASQMPIVKDAIRRLKEWGSRIILFVDPDPKVVESVAEIGADGIEIYTGIYAHAFREGKFEKELEACVKTAEAAHNRGLTVNIGHDLNLHNIPPLVERIPFVAEASIGHELTADALKIGFESAVRAYQAALRQSESGSFSEAKDPVQLFRSWLNDAEASGTVLANAMVLATASPAAVPSARIVLLKGFDERGFVFYTNYESQKARDLEENSQATLLFHWPKLERQVRISGSVSRVSREESEAYFKSRPRESQLGAWASAQSSVIGSRDELESKMVALRNKHKGSADIPIPPHWGGYRLTPSSIEFWQGRESRLHERIKYENKDGAWTARRLAP